MAYLGKPGLESGKWQNVKFQGYRYNMGWRTSIPAMVCGFGTPHAGTPQYLDNRNSGGTIGYEELLGVLNDPKHEEHEHYSEWAGDDFDPENFDLKATNRLLGNIKSNVREPKGNWI